MEGKSLSDGREQVGRRVDSCFGRARCQCDGAPGQDIARPATQLLLGGPGQRQFVGVTTVKPRYAIIFLSDRNCRRSFLAQGACRSTSAVKFLLLIKSDSGLAPAGSSA
jgi:hypothetical protein